MPRKVNNKYHELRARLIEKGTTINRWAHENGYPFTTAYGAARGLRAGVKATHIRKHLEQFAYDS